MPPSLMTSAAALRSLTDSLQQRVSPLGLRPVLGPCSSWGLVQDAVSLWLRALPDALHPEGGEEQVQALRALESWALACIGTFRLSPPGAAPRVMDGPAMARLAWGQDLSLHLEGPRALLGLELRSAEQGVFCFQFAPGSGMQALARRLAAEEPGRSVASWRVALGALHAAASPMQVVYPDAEPTLRASLGAAAAALDPETAAPAQLLRLGWGLIRALCAAERERTRVFDLVQEPASSWLVSLDLLPMELRAQAQAQPGPRARWGGAPGPGAVLQTRDLPSALARPIEALARTLPLDGVLVHGDSVQLLRSRPLPALAAVIFDPPYNTGQGLFAYEDRRDPQLWAALLGERAAVAVGALAPDGALAAFIDPMGLGPLRATLDLALERAPLATVAWQKLYTRKNSARGLSGAWDAVLIYARDSKQLPPLRLPWSAQQEQAYQNPDGDPRGPWICNALQARNPYAAGRYPLTTPGGREVSGPPAGTWWRLSEARLWALHAEGRIWWGKDGRALPRVKRYLNEREGGLVASDWWPHEEVGSNAEARQEARALLGDAVEGLTPKPTRVLMRLIELLAPGPEAWVMDHFAGSGALGHAALRLRRERGRGPKVLLVEAGEAFERALLPRVIGAAASSRWARGAPVVEDPLPVVYELLELRPGAAVGLTPRG